MRVATYRSTPPRRLVTTPVFVVAIAALLATTVAGLWAAGLLDLSRFRPAAVSTAGLVAVPVPARMVPAYTRLTRDHFWDPKNARLAVVYLPPAAVTAEMLTRLPDILGRVLDHDKPAGFVFTGSDFLPKGTREGLVAGIPAGKRAIRVEADKVEGLFGLRAGDRFDLVATLPISPTGAGNRNQNFNVGGAFAPQLAIQAQLSNWQKQATVRVLVQNGVIVEPMTTRQVPVFSRTLTQGAITRMRPVQEIVIAIDPDEVARLTEAMAVDAKVSTVPRSGRPDDPPNSVTPDLKPVSPFATPGLMTASAGGAVSVGTDPADDQPAVMDMPKAAAASTPFTMVETISGNTRELKAVPSR